MRKIILTAFASAAFAGAISPVFAQVPSPYVTEPYMQTDRFAPPGPQPRYDPRYDPESTGSVLIMEQVPVGPGLWPTCTAGPPRCTAAGYPNLRYMREGAY
jgi:hypothetical protein